MIHNVIAFMLVFTLSTILSSIPTVLRRSPLVTVASAWRVADAHRCVDERPGSAPACRAIGKPPRTVVEGRWFDSASARSATIHGVIVWWLELDIGITRP